jgi:hypothetical protein
LQILSIYLDKYFYCAIKNLMQDLIEAYMSVYGDVEEAKLPYTRRSMGLESQFVDKTGEEKTKDRIEQLKKTHDTTKNKKANTLERIRKQTADREAAEARADAMTRLRNRERSRFQNARDQAESFDVIDEKRLVPGTPDRAHRFPLTDEEREIVERIRQQREKNDKKTSASSTTKSASRKPTTKLSDIQVRESYDFYDLVLDHLLDEGYCESEENAISMMAAMSQDWIDSIVEEFVDH